MAEKKKVTKSVVAETDSNVIADSEIKEKVGRYLRGSYRLSKVDFEEIYKAL